LNTAGIVRETAARLVDVVCKNADQVCNDAMPTLKSYIEELVISQSPTFREAITAAAALELRRSPARLRKALEVIQHEVSETAKSGRQLSLTETDKLLDHPAWDALVRLSPLWWRAGRDAVRVGAQEATEALLDIIRHLRRAHGGRGKRTRYGSELDMIVGFAGNALDIAEGRPPRLTGTLLEPKRWPFSRPPNGGNPYGPFIRVATVFLEELRPDIDIRPDDIPHALERLFRNETDRAREAASLVVEEMEDGDPEIDRILGGC
jgi:hypothetical protein